MRLSTAQSIARLADRAPPAATRTSCPLATRTLGNHLAATIGFGMLHVKHCTVRGNGQKNPVVKPPIAVAKTGNGGTIQHHLQFIEADLLVLQHSPHLGGQFPDNHRGPRTRLIAMCRGASNASRWPPVSGLLDTPTNTNTPGIISVRSTSLITKAGPSSTRKVTVPGIASVTRRM